MTTYTRKDSLDNDWCSPEYMAAQIGLPLEACVRFLKGPEGSYKHGLSMTFIQATLFRNTLLSAGAEKAAML